MMNWKKRFTCRVCKIDTLLENMTAIKNIGYVCNKCTKENDLLIKHGGKGGGAYIIGLRHCSTCHEFFERKHLFNTRYSLLCPTCYLRRIGNTKKLESFLNKYEIESI